MRCRFNSPISLSSDILFLSAFDTTICTLSACAEWGSASYSARGFAPRPHKPSSAGLERALYLSLRSVLYFALCLQFTLVCFAHSSFLTPHLIHSSLSSYCILILFKQSTLLGVEQLVNDIANSRSVQPTSLQKSIAFISKYLKSQT